MALNYSQKSLLSTALHAKGNTKARKRLRLYALMTGFMSALVSLVHFLLDALT